MRTTTLGEIAEWGSGGTPNRSVAAYFGNGTPWLSIADLNDGVVTTAKESLTPAGLANSSAKVVPPGTLFIAMYGSIGKLGISGTAMATSQAIAFAKPNGDLIDRQFLFHYLLSQRPRLLALGRGGTQMNIGQGDLKAWPIPLPPLPEQRRIAAILDHADALRAKRRQVLNHLDSLAQSIFRTMFAQDVGQQMPLGEIADFFGGTSLPEGEVFNDQQSGFLLMKVSDMNSVGNEEEVRRTALWSTNPTPRSSTVGPGAVVLPKRGASIATNKKRLTTRPTALDPNLMGIQPRPEVLTSRYLHAWFKSFDLATITSGSTVPQLNKQDLAPLTVAVPSLRLQHEFIMRVEAVHAGSAVSQRALMADDSLFASLQSRAFRGEL